MTGYGKSVAELGNGKLTIEIRSVNSKSADISIKSSLLPKEKEIWVRKKIAEVLQRGTIDLFLTWEPNSAESAKKINKDLALEYFRQLEELGGEMGVVNLQLHEPNYLLATLLRMPDVIESARQEVITENNWPLVEKALEEALLNIDRYRTDEGISLRKDISSRVGNILAIYDEVEGFESERIAAARERILKAAEDLQLDVSKWKTSYGDEPKSVSVKAYHQLCNELRAVYDACEPRTDDDAVLVKTILAEAAKTGGTFKGLGADKDVGEQYRTFGVPPKEDLPQCPAGIEGTYLALTHFVKTEKQPQYAEQVDAVQARNARTLKNHLRQRKMPLAEHGATSVEDYRASQEKFESGYDERLKACFSHVLKFISGGANANLQVRDPYFDVLRSLATKLEKVDKTEESRIVVKTEWADLSKLTAQQKAILTEAAVRLELWKDDSLAEGKPAKFTKAQAVQGGAEKKLTITDCTQGTIDFTVPDEVPAGTYRLEVRSRAGEGLNRTLVTASIGEFAIKAA
mgnify:CR=1 FL=1